MRVILAIAVKSTIGSFLIPESINGKGPVVFYSKNEFGKFGGCLPHLDSTKTLVEIQDIYITNSESTGFSDQTVLNDDFSLEIQSETSATKIIVTTESNTSSNGYVTCWDQTNNSTSQFTILPVAPNVTTIWRSDNSTTDCECDIVVGACECCCDSDCSESEINAFFSCADQQSKPLLPWYIARDNSFQLGSFYFPYEFTPQTVDNTVIHKTCGDYYCLGDQILTTPSNSLIFYQNYYSNCASSKIMIGTHVRYI